MHNVRNDSICKKFTLEQQLKIERSTLVKHDDMKLMIKVSSRSRLTDKTFVKIKAIDKGEGHSDKVDEVSHYLKT